jgi:hypothetical protein
MRALAKPLSEHPGDDTFEKGLRWLLDGIIATGKVTGPNASDPPRDGPPRIGH